MRHLSIVLTLQVVVACSPQMTKISSRNPDLFEKEKDKVPEGDGAINPISPELFVRESRINIQPTDSDTSSGSLANPNDDRLHLFTDIRPRKVGRHINILVASSNGPEAKQSTEKNDGNDAKPEEKNGNGQSDKKPDALEEELLKTLPDLKPAQKDSIKLLKQFKMQVTHRFPNGDLLARISRSSTNPDAQEDFVAEAKIPAERLTSGEPLTTQDLVDVRVNENHGGEMIERRSTSWEDEYSLRLSGFTEAKSLAGLGLEEKRKELGDARDRLEDKIKAFAAEKRQFAAQRDQLKKGPQGQSDAANLQTAPQSSSGPGAAKAANQTGQGAAPSSAAADQKTANGEGKAAPGQPTKGEGNG